MSQNNKKDNTLAALMREKPKRGRPPRAVSRQNVYVALTKEQKQQMKMLAKALPDGLVRADIPDMAVNLLSLRLEQLRQAVSGRNREMPEGIVALDSLYLLWDLPLEQSGGTPLTAESAGNSADPGPRLGEAKWTSIRLSPQQVISLGRVHGILNALFGATRSEVFSLGLALLTQYINNEMGDQNFESIEGIIEGMETI
jgi:hypothetical protein